MLLSAQMLFYNKFYICSDRMRLVSKIKVASLGLQAYFGKTSLNLSWCGYFALKSHLTNSELIICMEQKADKRCSMWFSLLYLVQKRDNCTELKPAHGLKKNNKKTKNNNTHSHFHFVAHFSSHYHLFSLFVSLNIRYFCTFKLFETGSIGFDLTALPQFG